MSTCAISRKRQEAIGHLGEHESIYPHHTKKTLGRSRMRMRRSPGIYPHHTKKMLEVPYTQMLRFFFASLHEQAARTSGGQAKHARDALSAW